jgi:hypothetical protein
MHPGPLVLRELAVASRSTGLFRLRSGVGAGAIGLTIWIFLVWGTDAAGGRQIYPWLLAAAGTLSIVSSWLLAADCLSRERRDGTLGFLFLTDLSAPDVILGKLAGMALWPGSLMLAIFPGLALCQTIGGVSGAEFARGLLALGGTLFFSLAATLFVSAQTAEFRRALGGSGLLLFFLNPLWICLVSLDAVYSTQPMLFLAGFTAMLVLGAVMLASAAATIATAWRQAEFKAASGSNSMALANSAADKKSPVGWMMLRRRPGNSWAAWLSFVLPLAALPVVAQFLPRHLWELAGLCLLLVAHFAVQLLVFLRTAYSFYTDRQDGSLELLLGTKLDPDEIFSGFIAFLFRQTAPLLVAIALVDLLAALWIWRANSGRLLWPLTMGAILAITIMGLGKTGVYRSLMCDHPALAFAGTWLRLSAVPTIISLVLLFSPVVPFTSVAVVWLVTTAFTSMFFATDSSAALLKHGRELLLRPFSEKPPEFESEWSFINWDEEAVGAAQLQSQNAG